MKIILVNKFFYRRDGGTTAFFDMAKILEVHGHEVAYFSMKHPKNLPSYWDKYFVDEVDYNNPKLSVFKKAIMAFNLIYNFKARRKMDALIKEFKPDIAHLHVIYHQLTPSIIDSLEKNKIPTVMTLHDFKLISPSYNLMKDGKIWEKSKPNKYWACILDKCVKNSYTKSFLNVVEVYFHQIRRTYSKIDVLISPSRFLISKFKEYNFSKEIKYLPNPIVIKKQTHLKQSNSIFNILYFGRLSSEKGLDLLLKAISGVVKNNDKINLTLVGDGIIRNDLENLTHQLKLDDKVKFLGLCKHEKVIEEIDKSDLVILPSLCYENAPYTILETMMRGKVVLASDLGGIPELIKDRENGFLMTPGNINDMQEKIEHIITLSFVDRNQIGEKAAKFILEKFSPEIFYNELMDIYKGAISRANIK